MNELRKFQSVVLAEPAHGLPLPNLIANEESFTEAWISKMGGLERPSIHSLETFYVSDAIVSGRGHIYVDDRFLCGSEFIPYYWRNILANDDNIIRQESTLPIRTVSEPCVVFMGHGENIYGHFLMEMLPRLELAIRCSAAIGIHDLHFLINSSASDWLLGMLEDFGLSSTNFIKYNPHAERIRLKNAVLPVFVSGNGVFHPFCSHMYSDMADKINGKSPWLSTAPASKRLFISRLNFQNKASEARSLEQARQVEAIARDCFGFDVISPEELSWQEQISAFRGASVILGEAGSALHNAAFCSEGTIVASLDFRNMMQWEIGAFNRQKNAFLKCQRSIDPDRRVSALSVDLDLFKRWTEAFLKNI